MRQFENFRSRIGMAGFPPLPPTHIGGPTVSLARVYPRSKRYKHLIKTTIDYSFKRDPDLGCHRQLWTALSCSFLKTYRHIVHRSGQLANEVPKPAQKGRKRKAIPHQ